MKSQDSIGEGDREAGRRYQKETTAFAKSGRAEAAARAAAKAVEGDEGATLERARLDSAAGPSRKTIFERLREDHDTQRTLIDLVGKTHGDSDGRRELFARLDREMRAHAEAEERVFYSALLADESARDRAGHSVHEHKQMEELLDELADARMDHGSWLAKFAELAEKATHHVDEEENGIFQLAGRQLDDMRKREMTREFEDAKERALQKE
ncbi:MAG: hemerythrin domain-containing protein [Sandaracinaceae bacterium]